MGSDIKITEFTLKDIALGLPPIFDDRTLAEVLRTNPKTLWYTILYIADQYKHIGIPKKGGNGIRHVYAPNENISYISTQINRRILKPLHDALGDHVTAYRTGHSIKQGVQRHIVPCSICDGVSRGQTAKKHTCPREGTYIHMDLVNFFGTVRRSDVRNYFKEIGYTHYVSSMLAGLLTYPMKETQVPKPGFSNATLPKYSKYRVPQGAPASGTLCNLIADKSIDQKVLQYLEKVSDEMHLEKEWHFIYSRYSDDIVITCGVKLEKEKLKEILTKLKEIVHLAGHKINSKKTKVVYGNKPRKLLGIMFNRNAHIPLYDRKKMRAILHNVSKRGLQTVYEENSTKYSTVEELRQHIVGVVNWFNLVNPERFGKYKQQLNEIRKDKTLWTT